MAKQVHICQTTTHSYSAHSSMAVSSALLRLPFLPSPSSSSSPHISPFISSPPSPFPTHRTQPSLLNRNPTLHLLPLSYRFSASEEEEEEEDRSSFDDAVALFNSRDYYRCHDCLEEIWHRAEDPVRTLVHGILQCAVGLHHLFNQVCLSVFFPVSVRSN